MNADSELRHIKVAIHSATIASDIDRREALRLGGVAVIPRPFERRIVLAEIITCLSRPAAG